MTVDVAEPPEGEDANAKAVLGAAERIIEREAETVQVEEIMGLAMKVGAHLRVWRHMMVKPQTDNEGNEDDSYAFPEMWVDNAALNIFHKFFEPYDSVNEEELFDRLHEHWEEFHGD